MTASNELSGAFDALSARTAASSGLRSVRTPDSMRIAYLQDTLAERDRQVENLEFALSGARRIGAAIGIVMSLMKVTEDEAFTLIATVSQRQHRKLRLIADDIVLTGTI